ncbi:hypothetical protein K0M31_010204 [Melipona bicolor]|uniref:Uncharacterized protein n=1 Tax=Melipona bicolor TaxID=60889 RepID=A0AA40KIC1_9HYME|nr:hypothetical protein K0M31_010204 [Melipona bicolor]
MGGEPMLGHEGGSKIMAVMTTITAHVHTEVIKPWSRGSVLEKELSVNAGKINNKAGTAVELACLVPSADWGKEDRDSWTDARRWR